ncbi:MAG TPA: glycosyl hydrolase family 18 protein [Thermoanaerobaculia bacterium]
MNRRLIVAFGLALSASAAYANNYRISAWVRRYWDTPNHLSVSNFNQYNQGACNEVNPMWIYFTNHSGSNGPIVDLSDIHDPNTDVPTLSGAALVPTIKNHDTSGTYTAVQYMGFIFRSEADMNDHAAKIASLVNTNGWDGIDLDYESMLTGLSGSDVALYRQNFTSLVRRIKARLPNKIVSVSVYRRRSLSGDTDAADALAYDYKALTAPGAADFMKIMMYDDISGHSELVDDQAMEDSLTFADGQVVNHSKIIVALPWFAYDFDTSDEVASVSNASGLGRNASDEQTFTSPFHGVQIDAVALQHKILVTLHKHDVGGFAFYEPSAALSGVWDVIHDKVGTEGATAVAAANSGTCPGNGFEQSVSLPTGATSVEYHWFESSETSTAASSNLPLWVASGTTASPTLPAGFFTLRVTGLTGSKVFEVEADPIRSGCP